MEYKMRDIFELEKTTVICQDNSYIASYSHFISYFSKLKKIDETAVILGAHMVYGWMPTILDLYPGDENITLSRVAEILNDARSRGDITSKDLTDISKVINNSLVGASKLLHFIKPDSFPIWDSKIYYFVYGEKAYSYRVGDANKYLNYVDVVQNLVSNTKFKDFHNSVVAKVGYDITPARAVELVMFLNSSGGG